MKNLIRFTSLCGAVVLFPVGNTIAQTSGQCAIAPTCAELGYQQKAADCNGQYMLKCPFDQTKVFCGGTACSEDFKLTACDSSIGTCAECGGKYKYTACQEGWTLSSGNCVANDCPGYTLSSCPSNAYCSSCKSGSTTKYKFNSCDYLWVWNGSSCQYRGLCPGWNPSLSGNQTTYEICEDGLVYYKETACKSEPCTIRGCTNSGHYQLINAYCECRLDSSVCEGNTTEE